MKTPLPAPGGNWLVGHAAGFRERPLQVLAELARLGPVVSSRIVHIPIVLVSDPEGAHQVLTDTHTFDKRTFSYDSLRDMVGDGLVTSEGDFWKRQRRIAQPAFHRKRLGTLAERVTRGAEEVSARWAERAGGVVDVTADMTALTLGVTCESLLGGDDPGTLTALSSAFSELSALTLARLNAPVPTPLWVPTSVNRRFRAALATVDEVVYTIIGRRRADPAAAERSDLLSMLLATRDEETGETMDDKQLRDEVATILAAGFDTTAAALGWAFHLLAEHPDVAERLAAEARSVLGDRGATFADLEKLAYTRQVAEETLRLYPPVWLVSRNAAKDAEVLGHHVPKGTLVMVSSWVLHRHPALWDAPDTFDPDRFAPDRRAGHRKHAFLPFILGPRQCIGNHFAMMELQIVLATLAGRFRVRSAPGHVVVPDPVLTLRPRDGVRVEVERRRATAA